jgi:Cu(I)/Ag(I) efflux system protein CusF
MTISPAGRSPAPIEPVSTMNWPAMTMTVKAKDKALPEKMKQGEKVDFEFIQQGKDYIVTAVK